MKRIDGVLIEDITEKNIVSEPALKKIHQYEENSKRWKLCFYGFIIALVVNYIANLTYGKTIEGGLASTRIGTFLVSLITVFFIMFAVFYITDRRFPKKKWQYPTCKEKFPYFASEKECKDKGFILDCNTLGIRLARKERSPFILPEHCPNCKEKLWKEL